MMRRLVDPKKVLRSLVGWGNGGQKVLVVAGKNDQLMRTKLMLEMVDEYRGAHEELLRAKKIDGIEDEVKTLENGVGTTGKGVRYVELDASHHLQNNIGREKGADRLAEFWAQL